MIRNGTFALFSLVGESDYIVINSISQSFELPHFNLNSRPPHVVRNASFELNLRPPLLAVVADFARKQDWSAAHYIYDSPTGSFLQENFKKKQSNLDLKSMWNSIYLTIFKFHV